MSDDPFLQRVRAVSGAPGRWAVADAFLASALIGAGLVHGTWWLIAVGGAGTLAWVTASLPEVCRWRYERRRMAVIRAWHAEHPEETA